MGRSYSRSYSRSGSRSMSVSTSDRSRSSSYSSRSRSRNRYSKARRRSYSRSRSPSYRPRRRSPPIRHRYDTRRSTRQAYNRDHTRRFNGAARANNNLRFRDRLPLNNKYGSNSQSSKSFEYKEESPPFLIKIFTKIGANFAPEEIENSDSLNKYTSYFHIFKNSNLRDLINLLKGENPEYRSCKGFWKFYRLSDGQLIDLSRLHSDRLNARFDFKSIKDFGISIGEPLFVVLDSS